MSRCCCSLLLLLFWTQFGAACVDNMGECKAVEDDCGRKSTFYLPFHEMSRIHVEVPKEYFSRFLIKLVNLEDAVGVWNTSAVNQPFIAMDNVRYERRQYFSDGKWSSGDSPKQQWHVGYGDQIRQDTSLDLSLAYKLVGDVATLGLSSVCSFDSAMSRGISVLLFSVCTVFTVFGTRPPTWMVLLGMVSLALLHTAVGGDIELNVTAGTPTQNVDDGCLCGKPYQLSNPPKLYFYHEPTVTASVIKNADGSFDIICDGKCGTGRRRVDKPTEGPWLERVEQCTIPVVSAYYPYGGPGRPLLLNSTTNHKASAEVRWAESSSWVAPPPERVADLLALLHNNTIPTCSFANAESLVTSEEWVRRGLDEFIAVASFNRFSLDLLRFGAPANLVQLAQRAALEEVGHAKLSFSLAARFAKSRASVPEPGRLVIPDSLPLSVSVAEMAKHTFLEGCVGEFKAAVRAQTQLECVAQMRSGFCEGANAGSPACDDLEMLDKTLKTILAEESGHASLAFASVRWATERDAAAFEVVSASLKSLLGRGSLLHQAVLEQIVLPWFEKGLAEATQESPAKDLPAVLERAMQTVSARVLKKNMLVADMAREL